jgi:hypothetical protein
MRVILVWLLAATALLAQTEQNSGTEVSQVIGERKIEKMPLDDRRSMNMVGITGASVFVSYQQGNNASFSLASGRTHSQSFLVDGGNGQSMRLGSRQMDFDPPPESLSEVRIISNGYSAEFGGSASGVVAARIKSGGSHWRGSLFEYLRNDKLDAANFFAPIEGSDKLRAPLRYNVFGGTLGGPLRRNRTFLFLSNETSLRREGSSRSLTVPTALQAVGDFSATLNSQGRLIPIFDPATTRLVNGRYVRDQFPAALIPASRIDPVAASVVSFYPSPNTPVTGFTTANNFHANSGRSFDRNHATVKLDHILSRKDRLSVRCIYETDDQGISSTFPNPAAENQASNYRNQHNGFAAWNRTFRPSSVNDFRFTHSYPTNLQASLGLGGNWPSQLGLKGVPEDAFPRFQASGFSALGASNQEKVQSPIRDLQLVNFVSWTRSKHAWKFGVELGPSYNSEVDRATVSGNLQFNLQPAGQPGQANTGNGLATMLLGFPTKFTQRVTQVLDRSSVYAGAFAQDDWKAAGPLTLSLGLRWEMDSPMVDANGRMNGFDINAINPVSGAAGIVKFAGLDGWPMVPYPRDWNNFGPRVGFAWRPVGDRTVIRGGYGVFFAHPFDHSVTTVASLGYEFSQRLVTPDNGITAPFYLKDGVPTAPFASALDDSFGAVPIGQTPTTPVTFFEASRAAGYSQQFHFDLQYALPGGTVLDISCLGNLGRKLFGANLTLNQIRPELMGPAASRAAAG